MTINSISPSNTSQIFQAQRQQRKPPEPDDTAKLPGLSDDDLQNEIKSDLKADKPADAPDLSDDQPTQMATDVEAGKRPHGHHGHHGAPPQSSDDDDATTAESNLTTLASKVGLSQTELLNQLTSGTSFGDLLGSSNSTSNPYNAASLSNLGGIAVDEYA